MPSGYGFENWIYTVIINTNIVNRNKHLFVCKLRNYNNNGLVENDNNLQLLGLSLLHNLKV